MIDDLCGRPTRSGAPCRQSRARSVFFMRYHSPACYAHMTTRERADHAGAITREADAFTRLEDELPTRPACWSWPVTEQHQAIPAEYRMSLWQDGRCAVCGARTGHNVRDHDHRTGWERGLICQGCNGREAASALTVFRRYRRHNPATILGLWERYCHQFYGIDRGQVDGRAVAAPFPVDGDGVVHYLAPSLADDPAHLVSAATAPRQMTTEGVTVD